MQTLKELVKENITHRRQMWNLALFHQKRVYRGSDMGLVWAFVKPAMYIVVFYVAISIGFKSSKAIDGLQCPYFVWLAIGLIAFFYMRDMILNGAACFRKYDKFVAYTKYPIGTLPTSIAISHLFIHFGMLALGFVVCFVFGCFPSIYWIQIPFYMLLMVVFAIFWSIASGLITVLYKDFYNFLQVINQMVFWLSAILFDVHKLSPGMQKLFMFNPITYIVEGYRNAICRHIWFFEEPMNLACYLIVLCLMIIISMAMYKKLKKRLPDVLRG